MATAAKFPGALLTLANVGGEMSGIVTAVLSGQHSAIVTTITLVSAVPASWPTTGGWVTIDSEIIAYAGVSGSTLTGCTRAQQTANGAGAAAIHNDQSVVGLYLTPLQWNQAIADLIAVEKWQGAATPVPTIASATTTDLSTLTSNYAQVTGTVTITGFGTVGFTRLVVLEFAGILTLTHNATSLILRGGVNVTTAAGDVFAFISEGSGNWREVFRLTTASTGAAVALSSLTNQLAGNVAITANVYATGPSVAQGSVGTWFASGTVTVIATGSTNAVTAKLWDGTTVIASGELVVTGTDGFSIALSGVITSPAGNLRISATSNGGGNIVAAADINSAGNNASTITAIRIA